MHRAWMGLPIAGREVRETRWEWPGEETERAVMEQGSSGSREWWRGKEQLGEGVWGQVWQWGGRVGRSSSCTGDVIDWNRYNQACHRSSFTEGSEKYEKSNADLGTSLGNYLFSILINLPSNCSIPDCWCGTQHGFGKNNIRDNRE